MLADPHFSKEIVNNYEQLKEYYDTYDNDKEKEKLHLKRVRFDYESLKDKSKQLVKVMEDYHDTKDKYKDLEGIEKSKALVKDNSDWIHADDDYSSIACSGTWSVVRH